MNSKVKLFSHTTRRLRLLSAGAAVAAVLVGSALSASAVAASDTGSVSETISVGVRSLTVSPGSISECTAGAPMTFPNGACISAGVSITNGAAGGHVDINGANAEPADGGYPWTLCGPGLTATCSGSGGLPGQDQYRQQTLGASSVAGPYFGNAPICDTAFDGTVSGTADCTSTPGQVGNETVEVWGPSSSTDQSSTFTSSITWTAAP